MWCNLIKGNVKSETEKNHRQSIQYSIDSQWAKEKGKIEIARIFLFIFEMNSINIQVNKWFSRQFLYIINTEMNS